MNKKKSLYVVLFLSIAFNGLVVWYDVFPTIWPKVQNRYFPDATLSSIEVSESEVERKVYAAAESMLFSLEPVTVWHEPRGFTDSILKLRSITTTAEFQLDNYPGAFLLKGLFDYSLTEKKQDLHKFQEYFDNYILSSDYEIRRIDQVPVGLVALDLFKTTGENKYYDFSKKVFRYVESLMDEDGLLSYRKGQTNLLNDAIGLTVPFLVEYSQKVDGRGLEIAQRQIQFYVDYGLSEEGYIPSHAVDKKRRIPIGSSNWGRGIGWYLIGLSSYYKETGEFEKEYRGLLNTLKALRNEQGLWGQFPGSKDRFDASASLMFIFAELQNDPDAYSKSEVMSLMKNFISVGGEVLETSGDTYSANYYSSTFGKSELSQGLLLSIISQL